MSPDREPYRCLKDRFAFEATIDISGTGTSDVCELVRSHWEAVGIKINLNIGLRDIIWPRRVSGNFDIYHWGFEGPQKPLGRLDDWAIMGETIPLWHRNASGEGPEWLWEATRAIQSVFTTVDPVCVRELMERHASARGKRSRYCCGFSLLPMGREQSAGKRAR